MSENNHFFNVFIIVVIIICIITLAVALIIFSGNQLSLSRDMKNLTISSENHIINTPNPSIIDNTHNSTDPITTPTNIETAKPLNSDSTVYSEGHSVNEKEVNDLIKLYTIQKNVSTNDVLSFLYIFITTVLLSVGTIIIKNIKEKHDNLYDKIKANKKSQDALKKKLEKEVEALNRTEKKIAESNKLFNIQRLFLDIRYYTILCKIASEKNLELLEESQYIPTLRRLVRPLNLTKDVAGLSYKCKQNNFENLKWILFDTISSLREVETTMNGQSYQSNFTKIINEIIKISNLIDIET